MTWRRIDEITYIDDTLVTCAEYQLFIDEMCEQGKYYQPDHWTSYQFPAGQAREPILGVRHSDAGAFCEWLAGREKGDWKYRSPTMQEADNFLINYLNRSSLGYWVNNDYQFAWNGSSPEDARLLAHFHTHFESKIDKLRYNLHHAEIIDMLLKEVIDGKLNSKSAREVFFDLNRDFTHSLSIDPKHDLVLNLTYTGEVNRAVDLANERTIELNRALDLSYTHVYALKISLNFAREYGIVLDRELDLSRTINLLRERTQDLSLVIDRSLSLNRNLVLDSSLAFSIHLMNSSSVEPENEFEVNSMYSAAIYLYMDILTLQERIAGRSPAFEGIRLVKERIK
jgi:hypothetical protein